MDHTLINHEEVWDKSLQILQSNPEISPRQMALLTLSSLKGFLSDTALIAVPHPSVKDLFEVRIPAEVREALSRSVGRDVTFAVTVDETLVLAGINNPEGSVKAPIVSVPEKPVEKPVLDAPAKELSSATDLNPKFTFETFVVGTTNRFAHAAAFAVAENPAQTYNPLFIYGGSGLGKTHLLHAIGHYAKQLHPHIEVRYVSSEEFTNDFINSVVSGEFGSAQEFQRRYRNIDILLIDDIQFLQRGKETMEAFFHTFNTLHNNRKQIVITSDLPPKQLDNFEERLRSRFEMGLTTDVTLPDLETRIAILRKKIEAEGSEEIPAEVLEYIAENVSTNIRELEGALIRVQAMHSLSRTPLSVDLARTVLKDLLPNDGSAEVTAEIIIDETAKYFGFTVEDIKGSTRARALVTARQSAMYLCRELTQMPLTEIGKVFGGRDHTTVIHAYKKTTELIKERQSLFNQISELTTRIKSAAAQKSHSN